MRSQYKIGETGAWLDYIAPFNVGGNGLQKVYARTVDYASNVSEVTEATLKFDKTAPTLPLIELSSDDWANTDIFIRLIKGEDTESLVRVVEYKTGTDTDWLEFVDSFRISEEGITPIYARTVDWAGNISPITEGVAKIDLTAPLAPNFSPSSEEWTNTDVQLQIIPGQDSLSGADFSEYSLDESEEWIIYEAPIPFTEEGQSIVHAFSYDKAGNISDESTHTVRIDKTLPTSPSLTATT